MTIALTLRILNRFGNRGCRGRRWGRRLCGWGGGQQEEYQQGSVYVYVSRT